MTKQQVKRGVGRPRTGRGTRAVTLTLSNEVTEYLDKLPAGERSKFVDDTVKAAIEREREEQGNGKKNI